MRRVAVGTALLGALVAAGLAAWAWRHDDGVERASIGPTTVVLLGDSLTQMGDWSALLPRLDTANRGYSGYTTAELVPVAERVAREGPAAVLVLTGTNDIRDGLPPATTVTHLGEILDHFRRLSPDTTVVVQTILPRADATAAVAAANEAIGELVAARGVALLDLHPVFDDGAGGLRSSETTDGIHLSAAGYDRWARAIEAFLD